MSEQVSTTKNDAEVPVPPVAQPTARRRLLKAGLVGGPVALVTAGKPVKTLASSYYCSFSGWNSMNVVEKGKTGKSKLASVSPTGTCSAGHPPSYYCTTDGSGYKDQNWPSSFNGITLKPGTKSGCTIFGHLFGTDSLGGMTDDYVLNILGGNGSTCQALIIACGFSAEQVSNFPYTPSEILQLWETYGNNTNSDGSFMNYNEALQSFLSQLC
jgi:hypothetical protein